MPKVNTILIIEDEPDTQELIQTRLEANGFRVLTAPNGQRGVEQARRERPDLILCDIKMPVLDGSNTVLQLKTFPETATIPVIMLTGVNETDEKILSHHLGVVDYIVKPFDTKILIEKIRQALLRA